MSDLEQVTALGKIDAALDAFDKALAKQRARVPDAEAAIEAAKRHLDGCNSTLATAKEAERATAREVERYEKRRQQAQRALDSGMGNAEAADRQVQQCSGIIDELEGTQLEQMEVSEQAEAGVTAAQEALEHATAERTRHAAEAPPIIEDLVGRRAIKQAERDELFPQLHTEVSNRYTMLRKKKRTAVSLVQDATCIPCRRTVPMQDASEIRRGFLKSCRACGRYLVTEIEEA